jgi:hypothetical protein
MASLAAALFFVVSAQGRATTYTIQNPLGSFGNIWFPALTSSNIAAGGVALNCHASPN